MRGGDVEVGDLIITSGLGGVYPKGLRIGEVVEVSEPDAVLLQNGNGEPAVDFGRLEQVFVMLRRGPTMELLYAIGTDGDADLPDARRSATALEAGGLLLLVLGVLAVMLQGALVAPLPAARAGVRTCPSCSWSAIGLCWRSTAGGLLLAGH